MKKITTSVIPLFCLLALAVSNRVYASHAVQESCQQRNQPNSSNLLLEERNSFVNDYCRAHQGVLTLCALASNPFQLFEDGDTFFDRYCRTYQGGLTFLSFLYYQPLHTYKADPRVLVWEKRNSLLSGYCRQYKVPLSFFPLIKNLLYGNQNKENLEYLAEQDLRGIDFTGCQFLGINLTGSNLQGAILKNTTCNYLSLFEYNMGKNRRSRRASYFSYISKLIAIISYQLYPNCNDDTLKAKLLHIASGFAQLPFYENEEVNIKFQYWSFQLKLLKDSESLNLNSYQENQILQIEFPLNRVINISCQWKTDYLQDKDSLDLSEENAHANFNQYLQDFNKGCISYQVDTEDHFRDTYYTGQTRNSILWLGEAYPKIKNKALRKEARKIGKALSKSYQLQKSYFIDHYITCQSRLVSLKKLAERNGSKLSKINKKPYSALSGFTRIISWRRVR